MIVKKQLATILLSATIGLTLAAAPVASYAEDAASSAPADTTAACEVVQNPQTFTQDVIDNHVIAVLKQNQESIQSDVNKVQSSVETALKPYIAIRQMCSFAAGPIFDNAPEEDQLAFEDEFYAFIAKLYGGALSSFTTQTVTVHPSRDEAWKTAQRVQVNSVIKNTDGSPDIPVQFVLDKTNCSWMFLDFIVENISAMANIQSQLRSLIQNGSSTLPDLTAILEKKNKETSK